MIVLYAVRVAAASTTGDAAHDRARHQPGAARVLDVVKVAHQLARRVQAGDWLILFVQHLGLAVDLQPTEGKSDASGHAVGNEGRARERVGPVRFGKLQAPRRTGIADRRVEGHILAHGRVVGLEGFEQGRGIHAVQLRGQRFERVGLHQGDVAPAVFIRQQIMAVLVEDVLGDATRLFHDLRAHARVCVVAKVFSFAYEALSVGVDHHP